MILYKYIKSAINTYNYRWNYIRSRNGFTVTWGGGMWCNGGSVYKKQ